MPPGKDGALSRALPTPASRDAFVRRLPSWSMKKHVWVLFCFLFLCQKAGAENPDRERGWLHHFSCRANLQNTFSDFLSWNFKPMRIWKKRTAIIRIPFAQNYRSLSCHTCLFFTETDLKARVNPEIVSFVSSKSMYSPTRPQHH